MNVACFADDDDHGHVGADVLSSTRTHKSKIRGE